MNVLSIGSDEHIFDEGSTSRMRQEAYARELGHVDLIVLSKRPQEAKKGQYLSVSGAYATSPLMRLFRAYQIARVQAKPDVVTVQDPFEIGFIGWLVARRFGAPLHIQVHTDFLARGFARHSLLNRIRVVIARFTLMRAARVRVVSATSKANVSPLTAAPVSVVPIFTDLEEIRIAPIDPMLAAKFAHFKTRLLVVARLEPEKNVRLAIRAFAEVAPKDTCLIVVGKGSERAQLERLANKFGVSERVFFEDEQPSIKYYSLADLVLVPSKYEGYGLVIVEALAAGKPVLATDVGVAREMGAIVSSEENFANDLKRWFENGLRSETLSNYPYANFDEYIHAYCDDIRACTTSNLSL